ncbi:hypothetical protein BD414DRAFT_486372 [Trametes punicea]|nr:hypothetical protein BD414DRAFT_486372 [Trametes punicea]
MNTQLSSTQTSFKHPRRVRQVRARTLTDFSNTGELAVVMVNAIEAHQSLYQDAGILHGDVNLNTIIVFDFGFDDLESPISPQAHGRASGQGAFMTIMTMGGLIDYDVPRPRKA